MSFFSTNSKINIDSDKFHKLKNEGYKIIDVRTIQEYNEARIENSILIDIYSPAFKNEIEKLDKSEKYLIYCRSGNRSLFAAKYMQSKGFQDVFNLAGGIIKWLKSGKPVLTNNE